MNGRTGDEGGAIYNHGRLRVNNSTFSNNRAFLRGGAISNKGTLIINRSTFNGNRATATSDAGFGGAIKGWFQGSTSITNSTFYENRARFGGAIHHNDSLTLTNSTFVSNVSAFGSAIRSSGGFLWLRSSIFSGNGRGGACYHSKPDRITSGFDNYVDDGSCGETYTSDDGPINLGALTGSPAYYPLLAGSLAIDAADNNYCPTTDQAGTARPIGNGCDIGSHESSAEPPMRTATATATATITHTSTATATATTTPTAATDTPASPQSEFCVLVGPGTYWLFTSNRFLNGFITVYPGSDCEDFEITQTSIGDSGYVYTSAGQAAAEALCAAGHNDGSTYTVVQQAYNTDVWQCTLPATDTPTASPTATSTLGSQTQHQAATDTPAPPISSQGVYGLTLASNSAGELQVSWDVPGQSPNDYRVIWAKVGEAFPPWTASNGNAFPTSPSYTITALDGGERYKVQVRARYLNGSGDWTEPVEALVMAAPTATNTPTASPTATSTLGSQGQQQAATDTPAPPISSQGVYGLTLASNSAGELQVSWDVPGQSPNDYRVNWAKVGEAFPPWTASNGNAFPTSPSYTIPALDGGERYKVWVRARYSGGPPGPWSDEEEADVMAPLPTATNSPTASPTATPSSTATPSPIPASATTIPLGPPTNLSVLVAANGISLSWTAPSDDIDGYQILRRRPRKGEGQLLIHVENTGNNDTSYLDTDVSGDDERYAYRVKAIRAGMLSNRSGFVTVDVSPGDFLVAQQQQQEDPTATPIPPTSTPVPPTSTPVPTATPLPPTSTPVPTATPLPPTNTPIPTSTPIPPTYTPIPPLRKPKNLTASAVADGVELNWDAPAGQVDGYEILRRRPRQGEDTLQTLVADTGSSATTYTDTTATESTRYTYRVKAIRNGEKSNWSNYDRVDR